MSPTPIFIGGCPRSGTTYVRNLIASHPDVTGLTARDFGLAGREEKTLEGWLFHRKLAPGQILARWQAATINCATPYAVEKTPSNALCFQVIKALFPQCITVLVKRRKADTVRSILKASSWAPLPRNIERAEALYARYEKIQCAIVADYDLLTRGPDERARLYRAIGLAEYDGPVENPEGVPGSKRKSLAA